MKIIKILLICSLLLLLIPNVFAFNPFYKILGLFIKFSPEITAANVYPVKIKPGDVLLINVTAKDIYGISKVTAKVEHESGFDLVELSLKKGNNYQGTWICHNAKNMEWYDVDIEVTNKIGISSFTKTQYQDPTKSHPAAEVTAGTFDAGNFTFQNSLVVNDSLGIGTTSPGRTLEVSGYQRWTFPAHSWELVQVDNDHAGFANTGVKDFIRFDKTNGDLELQPASGNVGIGTTGPSEKLDILSGNIELSDGYGIGTGYAAGLPGRGMSTLNTAALGGLNFFAHSWGHVPHFVFRDAYDNSSWMVITGGKVGIGMANPSVQLDITGDIEYTGTITDVSDIRLKENIEPIEDALSKIEQLQGFSFNMKNENKNNRQLGVSAQDVQKQFPEAVSIVDPDNGYLGVDYTQLVPVLLEAVKELNAQNQALKQELCTKDSTYSWC